VAKKTTNTYINKIQLRPIMYREGFKPSALSV